MRTLAALLRGAAESLRAQPLLVVVLLLNAIFCGAATFYLLKQEGYRHTERMQLIEACLGTGGRSP